jgi:hypothetical protein
LSAAPLKLGDIPVPARRMALNRLGFFTHFKQLEKMQD